MLGDARRRRIGDLHNAAVVTLPRMSLVPTVTLPSGTRMPRLGLGTWPLSADEAERAVASALEVGYRLFDTAYAYGNETGVGKALAAGSVPREEVFITTKINAEWHGFDEVREAFDDSARKLGVDYLDLHLIHWPNPRQDRYVDAWRGLCALRDEGLVRSIGVSNFKPAHIERLLQETGVAPELNQIELNPYLARTAARSYHEEHGIVTQSYSPLEKAGQLLAEPVVVEAAERLGRTPAQVVLRWHEQLGLVTVPKSSDPARQAQNLEVFDFELTDEEMAALSALDRGEAAATDSDTFGH
jgi:2,5-diketo-D-gluconate reductase A